MHKQEPISTPKRERENDTDKQFNEQITGSSLLNSRLLLQELEPEGNFANLFCFPEKKSTEEHQMSSIGKCISKRNFNPFVSPFHKI